MKREIKLFSRAKLENYAPGDDVTGKTTWERVCSAGKLRTRRVAL